MENKMMVMRRALRDVSQVAEEMTRGTMTGGSVAFCLGVHCISAALDLPREDFAHGALAYMAIYAILTAREGGAE